MFTGDKLVYAEAYSGDIVSLNSRTGKLAARKTVGACLFPNWASPVAAGGIAYVPRMDGTLHAMNVDDMSQRWSLYLGDSQAVRPGTRNSETRCRWEVASGHSLYSPPAIAPDGTILLGTSEGYLYAIEESVTNHSVGSSSN